MSVAPIDLLSEALRERTTALNREPCVESGAYVLYWLRTAVRAHENPALDAAIELSDSLGIPLFVYHALSERYPFASDRHHRFILEGARDAQAEFAARGIAYAFHLERPGQRGDHLLELGRNAAAIVTESFPWTPIRRWTRSVAEGSGVGMIGVDAACLVPMRTVPAKARDRAFQFRKTTAARRQAALAARTIDLAPTVPSVLPALPFEPVDLQEADLADLVASCEIDHMVGPVPHTCGGSRAGYARWAAFRDGGLRRYNARRNDALDSGVSRMSAYLHYGHVSPFRIAREAAAIGGAGADKYLDELLIWREMSWAWAFHARTHDDLSALPAWAQETLAAHAGDERQTLHDWERLARARTGDALWDAAQTSLLVHGELHNNVRMTWGKMVPLWTRDPARALSTLIDLNHRYALDGRDPNSYGGLLWCLGGFDRPFEPARPVLGTVRPRDTAIHGKRLDVAAYAARTGRPAHDAPPRVAVIGAGMAGLIAARTLADHRWPVTVFDKGRRAGGRLAIRTSRTAPAARFDHGGVAFSAEDSRFARYVDAWSDAGLVVPIAGAERYAIDIAGLIDHLAEDLDVACETRIEHLRHNGSTWTLETDRGMRFEHFDALVLNMPPAQASALLAPIAPALATTLAAVPMAPGWTVMTTAVSDQPWLTSLDGDLAKLINGAAHPIRPAAGCITAHAATRFSAEHIDATPEDVAALLAPELEAALGIPVAPEAVRAHRWRYARAVPAPEVQTWHPEHALALCGDWTGRHGALSDDGGPGVEAAFLSGAAAAGRLLGSALQGPTVAPARPLAQDDLFA